VKKIKRVYHHYKLCEEYETNMWKQVPVEDRQDYQDKSRALMLDCDAFEAAMRRAADEWPFSCEVTLTAPTMNHLAWMGHAGCAINHNAPEDITRLAWRTLNEEEQDRANGAASNAIEYWRAKYVVAKAA
jgi:hypothetical protein